IPLSWIVWAGSTIAWGIMIWHASFCRKRSTFEWTPRSPRTWGRFCGWMVTKIRPVRSGNAVAKATLPTRCCRRLCGNLIC
ncbi:uncharacterized protein METZ01_LOCUS203591, partial [marine metagenome]